MRLLWCIFSSLLAAETERLLSEVGRLERGTNSREMTRLLERLNEAESNIAKINSNQKQQTESLNVFDQERDNNEMRLRQLETDLKTCRDETNSNKNVADSTMRRMKAQIRGILRKSKIDSERFGRFERKIQELQLAGTFPAANIIEPIVDDDTSRLLSTLENRVDNVESSQQRILNLEIAENLRSMELRIDEVEKNAVSSKMMTPVVSEISNNDQYRAVEVKLEQLQETQNSMKELYEKLFEQSKYMSDGYAQQDYVSKELSRLNDTLTREISQVKFSMAQMDDCCLRQDVSETEPVQILPNYLSEEKIMSMNDKLTDLYQRIQSRSNDATTSGQSYSYLEEKIQKLEDELDENKQSVFRKRTLLNNKISENTLQIVAQQKKIDDLKEHDLQQEKALSLLQFDVHQIRSSTEANSLKFQNQITSLEHENTKLRIQYEENFKKLVSLDSKLNYADNYADEFDGLEKLSREAIIQASTLKSQVGVFQNRLSNMNLTIFTHLYAHDKTVDSVSKDIQQMKSRIEQQKDSLSSIIQEVQVQQGEESDKIRELRNRIADGFSLNEEEVARIQQNLQHFASNSNFASGSDEIAILKSTFNKIQTDLDSQEKSIEEIRNEQKAVSNRVALVESSKRDSPYVSVFEERLAEVNSTIFTKEIELKADARVVYDDFAAKYLEIVDSLKDLNVRNSQIQQVLSTVQESRQSTSYSAVIDKIDDLDLHLSTLNATAEDLYDRIDELDTNTTEKLYRMESYLSPGSTIARQDLQRLQNIVEKHSRRISEIFEKVNSETVSTQDLDHLKTTLKNNSIADTVQSLAATVADLESEMVVSGDLDRLTARLKNIQDKFHRFQSTNRLEIIDLKKALERTRNDEGPTSNEDFQGAQGGSSSVRRLSDTVKKLSNMQKKIVGGFNEVLTRFNKQQEFLKAGFDRIGELENSCCSDSDSESDYTEYDSPSSSSSSSN